MLQLLSFWPIALWPFKVPLPSRTTKTFPGPQVGKCLKITPESDRSDLREEMISKWPLKTCRFSQVADFVLRETLHQQLGRSHFVCFKIFGRAQHESLNANVVKFSHSASATRY